MSLEIFFKNDLGTVNMSGVSGGNMRIIAIEGLGLVEKEYNVAVYSGYDGQETVSSRALPRTVTISAELCGENIFQLMKDALRVLGSPGYLYIKDGNTARRIFCNQVRIPDPERVLRGRISTLAVQLVCDSPYFENAADIIVPLYKRTKNLVTPFELPSMFGTTVMGATIINEGCLDIEPIFKIYCPNMLTTDETIIITNRTTGKKIVLSYAPQARDEITVDVKNRRIESSLSGSLLNNISGDTFLGDFVFISGYNEISTLVGNVASGFSVECRYTNLYDEAVVV